MNDRYSKLAFLHRVKERKTPSLSAQASFAPFSLKVAWSGKSLINIYLDLPPFSVILDPLLIRGSQKDYSWIQPREKISAYYPLKDI